MNQILKSGFTVEQAIAHFAHIYGRKNALFMKGLSERVHWLQGAIRNFHLCHRKREKTTQDAVRKAAASVFSRWVAVVDHFRGFPLNYWLCKKLPADNCGNCHQEPCTCPDAGRLHNQMEIEPQSDQLSWSVRRWQEVLQKRYGQMNATRGISDTFSKLRDEVAEVTDLVTDPTCFLREAGFLEREFATELADVFAWISAVATLMGVDLEDAIIEFYGRGCLSCHATPCECVILHLARNGNAFVVGSHPVSTVP